MPSAVDDPKLHPYGLAVRNDGGAEDDLIRQTALNFERAVVTTSPLKRLTGDWLLPRQQLQQARTSGRWQSDCKRLIVHS
jgi:hypothetical protein